MSRIRFKDWSIPHPHDEGLIEAMYAARYSPESLTRGQLLLILEAADAYRHLAGHPATTESIVSQLRQVRSAVRATGSEKP